MIGNLHRIKQTDPELPPGYWRVLVEQDGAFETLMLTDGDLKKCRERAAKNPKDLLTNPDMAQKSKFFFWGKWI